MQQSHYKIEYRIEQFRLSDGKTWDWNAIKALALAPATEGNDIIYGYVDEDDALDGLGGDDSLKGDNGNDILNGGSGNDSLFGDGGNDNLNGGTGNDFMEGGYGKDTYWVDAQGDTIHEDRWQDPSIDSIFSSIDYSLQSFVLSGIENITLLGEAYKAIGNANSNIITGNSQNNTLSGAAGNDTLKGMDGNDSLYGDGGNDTLDGGNGSDMAHYWTAKTGVEINLSLTTAPNTLGAGTDTLLNIENLNGSAFNDTLTGNNAVNSLYGNAGNDILKGLDGNDSLAGGAGNDTLDGGVGEDFGQYWQATAGVVVDLRVITAQNTQGAGIDTLQGIEHLNGSAFNDTLIGNASNNRLLGGAGNDNINGLTGKDALTGGTGQDRFVFNTAPVSNNLDFITDFNVADDTLVLENAIFTTLSQTGPLAASLFKVLGTGGTVDADDRVLYNSVTGGIAYDADGAGGTAAANIALIGKGLELTAADFSVV